MDPKAPIVMAKKKSKPSKRRPFKNQKPFMVVIERDPTEPAYGGIDPAKTFAVFKAGSASSPPWTCLKGKVDPNNDHRALLKLKAQTITVFTPPPAAGVVGPGTLTVTVQDTAQTDTDDPFDVDVEEVDTDPC